MEEQLTQASAHVSQVAADECGPTMVHHLSPTQAAQAARNRQERHCFEKARENCGP